MDNTVPGGAPAGPAQAGAAPVHTGPAGNMGTTGTTNAAGGQQDYLDKGLDAAEKKFGGGKIDPVKHRALNEKITDGARKYFEKITGKKVPSKISN